MCTIIIILIIDPCFSYTLFKQKKKAAWYHAYTLQAPVLLHMDSRSFDQ